MKTPVDVSEEFDAEFDDDTLELHLSPAELLALSRSAEQILAKKPVLKAVPSALASVPARRPALRSAPVPSPSIARSAAPVLTPVPTPSPVATMPSAPTSRALPNASPAPTRLASTLLASEPAPVAQPMHSARKPDSTARSQSARWAPGRIAGIVGIATLALALAILTIRWSQSNPTAPRPQDDTAATPTSDEPTSQDRASQEQTSQEQTAEERTSEARASETDTPMSAGPSASVRSLPPTPTASTSSPSAPRPPKSGQDRPIRVKNPFDRSEVFEFPAGTSKAEARDQVAQLLWQRALERQPKRPGKQPAHNNR